MTQHRAVFVSALVIVAAGWHLGTRVGLSCGDPQPLRDTVGRHESGRVVLPVPQTLTPLGLQIELPGMRPQAMALSPDGRLLAVSGKTNELVILDPGTGKIVQRVPLPIGRLGSLTSAVSPQLLDAAAKSQLSYTGLIFSPDGRRICLSNVEGDVKVFQVGAQGKVTGLGSISLPPADAPDRQVEIPAGLAITADGLRLYVAGNLSNTLLEFELHSGRLLRRFDVGVAPYDVVLVQGKAYVSNWGGRRPGAGDLVASAGLGTLVRVDPVRHIASEGSVTIVDLASGEQTEVVTHLHTSALAVSPDGQFVVCANAGSDNLSVIVTASRRVVETIWAKLNPSELLGATPNALAFAPDGRTLYVANGTQNAIAVIDFAPQSRHSKLRGLLPVGWFPGALAFDARPPPTLRGEHQGAPERTGADRQRIAQSRVGLQFAKVSGLAFAGAAAGRRPDGPVANGVEQPPPPPDRRIVCQRLFGKVLRQFPPQLSRRDGRRGDRRAGLVAGRIPLGSGIRPAREPAQLRRIHRTQRALARTAHQGQARFPRLLLGLAKETQRRDFRVPAVDRHVETRLAHALRGLVSGSSRSVSSGRDLA